MFNVKKILFLLKSENALGVILCCIFSIVSLFFLIKVKPPSSTAKHPAIAKIKKFEAGSKQRISGTMSFIDIESNNNLQNNDEIYTGKNSKITIEFLNSKNQVIIPSGSLVRVENNVEGEVLEIKEGRVDITIKQGMAAKIISEGQTIQLTNTNAEEGTIRAFKSKDKITFNQIKSSNPGHDLKLMKIEQLSSSPEPTQENTKLKPPAPPPVLMESQFELKAPKENIQLGLREPIKFRWSGSDSINVTMAKTQDQLFGGSSRKLKNSPADLGQNLDLGSWYLGIESEKGEKAVVPIEIFNNFKVTNAKPGDGETVELIPDSPLIFSWSELDTKKYEITVKDSKGLITTYNSNSNQFKLEKVTGNNLEWYVTPILSDGAKAPSSKDMKVNLKYNGELKFTGKLALTNVFQLSEKHIQVSRNSTANSKFTLFNEKNEKILEKEFKNNSIDLSTLKLGQFKATLSSIDYPTLTPAISTFEIHTPIIEWDQNNKNIFMAYDPKLEIALSFKSAVNSKESLIPVINFNDQDLTLKDKNWIIDQQKIKIVLNNFGRYCIKVNPISLLKYYDTSVPFCFDFREIEPFKTDPILKTAILKHTYVDEYDAYATNIPPVERAVKYHFEVYKTPDMKELLFEYDSKTPSMSWITRRSGVFYYRYKVYDYKNRESKYSNLSKFILPISPFHKLKDE